MSIRIHTYVHTYMHTYMHAACMHACIHIRQFTRLVRTSGAARLVYLQYLYDSLIHTYIHTYIHAYIHIRQFTRLARTSGAARLVYLQYLYDSLAGDNPDTEKCRQLMQAFDASGPEEAQVCMCICMLICAYVLFVDVCT